MAKTRTPARTPGDAVRHLGKLCVFSDREGQEFHMSNFFWAIRETREVLSGAHIEDPDSLYITGCLLLMMGY